jgi:hypothetical protein
MEKTKIAARTNADFIAFLMKAIIGHGGKNSYKRFYEKVIKVKAEVAAGLNYFFPSCMGPPVGDLGSCQGRRRRGRSS